MPLVHYIISAYDLDRVTALQLTRHGFSCGLIAHHEQTDSTLTKTLTKALLSLLNFTVRRDVLCLIRTGNWLL